MNNLHQRDKYFFCKFENFISYEVTKKTFLNREISQFVAPNRRVIEEVMEVLTFHLCQLLIFFWNIDVIYFIYFRPLTEYFTIMWICHHYHIGLPILTCTWHCVENSMTYTCTTTIQQLTWPSLRTRYKYTCCRVFDSGAVTTCSNELGPSRPRIEP